jgi:acetyl esterase
MPLSPEYQAMFEQLAAADPAPPLWEMTPEQGREMYHLARPVINELPVGDIINQNIPGPKGDIPVRIYFPKEAGTFGTLLYFHGGGWVIGGLDTCDAVCREISLLSNVTVVSVDYRMAPEAKYPAAVDDCYAALEWAGENGELLKANGKLGVAGESAGGNLSAAITLKSKDLKGPKIDFQCLLYPVTDCDLTRQSYKDNGQGFLLETQSMLWFWDIYCPDKEKREEAYASPLRSEDLSDLPKALVVTAEFDPLRDEGEAYAEALIKAGSRATYKCYEGMVHDFFSTATAFESSRVGLLETIETIKAELS